MGFFLLLLLSFMCDRMASIYRSDTKEIESFLSTDKMIRALSYTTWYSCINWSLPCLQNVTKSNINRTNTGLFLNADLVSNTKCTHIGPHTQWATLTTNKQLSQCESIIIYSVDSAFNGSLWVIHVYIMASKSHLWRSLILMNNQPKPDFFLFSCSVGGQFSFQLMQQCARLIKSRRWNENESKLTEKKTHFFFNLAEHMHCAPFISKVMNSIDWRPYFFLPSFICADCCCFAALTFVTNVDFKCWSLFQIRFDYDDEKWNCFLLCSEESWMTPAFYTLCGSLSYVLSIWQCVCVFVAFVFFRSNLCWHFFHLLFIYLLSVCFSIFFGLSVFANAVMSRMPNVQWQNKTEREKQKQNCF